eukprot:COSAG06_NODE_50094_length_321_cov_0.617117_1_plen_76_part_10
MRRPTCARPVGSAERRTILPEPQRSASPKLIDEKPHLADINVSSAQAPATSPKWFDHQWWKKPPNRSYFEIESGVL